MLRKTPPRHAPKSSSPDLCPPLSTPVAIPTISQRQTLHLLLLPPQPPQQPIRHTDNLTRAIPTPALLRMLNRMRDYPPLLIELKDEQAAKLLIITRIAAQPLGDLVDLFTGSNPSVKSPHSLAPGLPARLPTHDQFLIAGFGR